MAKVQMAKRLKHNHGIEKSESDPGKILKDMNKKPSKLSDKKDWEDTSCPICLEHPHNAVLLLCSSFNKGCRPYICATNYRLSNCLDQYKQAYTKSTQGPKPPSTDKVPELLCPLCRGPVKGWTLVEPARKHLNKKERTCMQEKCSFVGNYKQLKKHAKLDHPSVRPREVDELQEEKWKSLETERELNDVMSSFGPGALVVGDYVLDDDFGTYRGNTFGSFGGFNLFTSGLFDYDESYLDGYRAPAYSRRGVVGPTTSRRRWSTTLFRPMDTQYR